MIMKRNYTNESSQMSSLLFPAIQKNRNPLFKNRFHIDNMKHMREVEVNI